MKSSVQSDTKMNSPTLRQYMKQSIEKRNTMKSRSKSKSKKENVHTIFKAKANQLFLIIKLRVKEKSLQQSLNHKLQELLLIFQRYFESAQSSNFLEKTHQIKYENFQTKSSVRSEKLQELQKIAKIPAENFQMTQSLTKQQIIPTRLQKVSQYTNINSEILETSERYEEEPELVKEKRRQNMLVKGKKQNEKIKSYG